MVKPFQFARLPLIYFGPGKFSLLTDLIMSYGTKVLLVTGKSSFMNSYHSKELLEETRNKAIRNNHVIIPGEPTPGMIDEAVTSLRYDMPDVVVAVGGGSVLDAGKAISAMLTMTDPVKEFMEGVGTKNHPGTKCPFIAVPTTSGTGSEATKNAVISETGKKGFKKSLRHDNFVPDIAVVDPELTINCPVHITAASGMDCFTQLTEAYLSDKSNEYTDALAFEGLKAIRDSLKRSCSQGDDLEARTGMSFAALTSGICLANAGLGIVHGFASSIGGMYNIPHGLVCGTLMASSNEINIRELRKQSVNQSALKKYALLGELFLNEKGKTDDYYIDGFVGYLKELTHQFQLPGLQNFGIEEKDIETICAITEVKNNPVKLVMEDMAEIISSRLL